MTQQRKPEIIKETIIIVDKTHNDDYGNLIVTDKEGKETKVSNKREHLFNLFQPGVVVRLSWAEYMKKQYVSDAQLVKDAIPEQPPKQPTETPKKLEATIGIPREAYSKPEATRDERIDRAGLWKELGKRIGDGSLDKDYPKSANKIKVLYYTEMFTVLNIQMGKIVQTEGG